MRRRCPSQSYPRVPRPPIGTPPVCRRWLERLVAQPFSRRVESRCRQNSSTSFSKKSRLPEAVRIDGRSPRSERIRTHRRLTPILLAASPLSISLKLFSPTFSTLRMVIAQRSIRVWNYHPIIPLFVHANVCPRSGRLSTQSGKISASTRNFNLWDLDRSRSLGVVP